VVPIRLPRAAEERRRNHDAEALRGVPAHITILYPFAAPDALTAGTRRALIKIVRTAEPFDCLFASVGRFPEIVYVVPEPAEPFRTLTQLVIARFPEYPPYDGAFAAVIPHLGIGRALDRTVLDSLAAVTEATLPFKRRVTRLAILVEAPDGRWRTRWSIPLAGIGEGVALE
jgi:2'-5' RNA ligase